MTNQLCLKAFFSIFLLSILCMPSFSFGQTFINLNDEKATGLDHSSDDYSGTGGIEQPEQSASIGKKFFNELVFSYYPSLYSYKFTAADNSNIKFESLGHLFELRAQFGLVSILGFYSKVTFLIYEFDDLPSGISPTKVSGDKLLANWGLTSQVYENDAKDFNLNLFFGHRYFQHHVDVTTPIQITEWEGHSVGGGVFLDFQFESLVLKFEAGMYSIFQLDETPVESGFFNKGTQLHFETAIQYGISESIKLNFSYQFENESMTFKGSSTRNVSNAKMSNSLHSLGIGIIYDL